MAFKKIRTDYYIADTITDLDQIKDRNMGIECQVIQEAALYCLMSTGEWVRQTPERAVVAPESGLTEIEVERMIDRKIAEAKTALIVNSSSNLTDIILSYPDGIYSIWIDRSQSDLPEDVILNSSPCQGMVNIKDKIAQILIFDNEGELYTATFSSNAPLSWKRLMTI